MKIKIRLLFLLSFCYGNLFSQVKEFYKQAINSTILLYKKDSKNGLVPHGTAFTLYNYDSLNKEQILVTCEHLTHHDTLYAAIPASDSIKQELIKEKINILSYDFGKGEKTIEFDGNNLIYKVPLKIGFNYFKHGYLDFAVIFCELPSSVIIDKVNRIRLTDLKSLSKSFISEAREMYVGQEITFVGFPYGIGTKYGFQGLSIYSDIKSNPLLRKGIISWSSERSEMFLVDGFSFSGNSGSPIFSIPSIGENGKFVGMVIGHLSDTFPIKNVFIDTVRKQLVENNSVISINNGLAQCIPSYIIYEVLSMAISRRNRILFPDKK